jgi:hypothetical protein
MTKKITATVCFLMFSLMLMALTTSVKAPNGSYFRWVNPHIWDLTCFMIHSILTTQLLDI